MGDITRPNGFTLVEMLVALVIFALLAAGGVGLLRGSVATRDAVDRGLSGVSGQERVIALLQSDLGQAIARPLAGLGEARQLPFDGQADRLTLVRAGWVNPALQQRSSLQRVDWSIAQGSVTRTAHVALESIDDGQAAALAKATALSFRYRRAGGEWVGDFRSTRQELLPAAVEVTIATRPGVNLVVIVALPPRGLEPKAVPVGPAEQAA